MKTERKDCTGCAHYGVCKWVDDYNIVVNQAGYADICGPFTINVECNHYEHVKPVMRGFSDVYAVPCEGTTANPFRL